MQHAQGRPVSAADSQSRARLIDAARQQFSLHGYSATTTRDIAAVAGVNPAMIRYYFGSKAGLFETVLRETIAPLFNELKTLAALDMPTTLVAFVRQYHSLMAPHPELPKLIFLALHNPGSAEYDIVIMVFNGVIQFGIEQLLRQMTGAALTDNDNDTKAVLVSTFALAIFPFLLPDPLRKVLNFSITPAQLDAIASHAEHLLPSAGIVQQGAAHA